ncbi:hypothetical protein RI367_006676 [Sorochytrium milnesiophthora]
MRFRLPRVRILIVAALAGVGGAAYLSAYRRNKRMAVIHDDTILHWKVTTNSVVEAKRELEPFSAAQLAQLSSREEAAKPMTLLEAIRALKLATHDDRVTGLCARFVESVNPGGVLSLGQLQEIRDAVEEFKAAKKDKFGERAKIVAFSETMEDQWMYLLASAFDKIVIQPAGSVAFFGMGATSMFFKNMLDKIGVKVDVEAREEYKSAMAPLTERSHPAPHKADLTKLLTDMNEQLLEAVAISRPSILPTGDLTARKEKLRSLITDLPTFTGREAVRAGLVDGFGYRDSFAAAVISHPPKSLGHYLRIRDQEIKAEHKKNADPTVRKLKVAVVYLIGGVKRSGGQFSAANVAQAMREAAIDSTVDAIVLRLDTPGGDVVASDTLWGTVRRIQTVTGKPVVASYAGMSASGGYYASASADAIVANPGTITGSIGVIGGRVTLLPKLLDKLGITVDNIYLNDAARFLDVTQDMTPAARAKLKQHFDEIYQDFLTKVAAGRGKEQDEVRELARGRLYSGREALSVGLVDKIGGIYSATRIAAQMALKRRNDLETALKAAAMPAIAAKPDAPQSEDGQVTEMVKLAMSSSDQESMLSGEQHIVIAVEEGKVPRIMDILAFLHQQQQRKRDHQHHRFALDDLPELQDTDNIEVVVFPRAKSFLQRVVEAKHANDLLDIFWYGAQEMVIVPLVRAMVNAGKQQLTEEASAAVRALANPSTGGAVHARVEMAEDSIQSGDSLLVVRNGKEQTLSLAFIQAPRFGSQKKGTEDEPFAFQARDTLRKTILGKPITFVVEFTAAGRDYCSVFATSPAGAQVNVATLLLNKGFAKTRVDKKPTENDARAETLQTLSAAEDKARDAGLGLHGDVEKGKRSVHYSLEEDATAFLNAHKGKPLDAIVEQVRDGSTYRLMLVLPNAAKSSPVHQYINVMLSGVKAPTFKVNIAGQDDVIEPFAEEAKTFVEVRLLQRDVKVTLEAVAQGNNNFVGSVVHPVGGNMAEVLLKEGLVKIVDWSLNSATAGPAKLRAAEKEAKERRLRLWKEYVAKPTGQLKGSADFHGVVTKIISGDMIAVRPAQSRDERKISLASIRQAKKETPRETFYHHEAKETLRKMLIGRNVSVHIDYVKPASEGFEERECGQIKLGDKVVSEILVERGLAFVIKHRRDDDNRASNYDQLVALENEAQEKGVGVYAKEPATFRVPNDVSEASLANANKAKQFLPFLKRSGRTSAVVEHVASGSRFRLSIPKESARISMVLGGIRAPRSARPNSSEQGEPFGEEALQLSSDLAYQRDVEIEVDSVDKNGSFIGALFVKGTNVAVALLEHGYASVHAYSAENSPFTNDLFTAERAAKLQKKGMWANYDESAEQQQQADVSPSRDASYTPTPDMIKVCISEYVSASHFYVQPITSDTAKLSAMMRELTLHCRSGADGEASFTPKNGAVCAARFSEDGQWYRAKIRKINAADKTADVIYTDYGNSEVVSLSALKALPATFTKLPQQAQEATLTYITVPALSDSYGMEALDHFKELTMGKELVANVDSRSGTLSLTLFDPEFAKQSSSSPLGFKIETSVNADMLLEGCALLDKAWLRRTGDFISRLVRCEEDAKNNRRCMWEYGDIRGDDM